MTNYDRYIKMLQTNKSKLASILSTSCSCCPRKYRTDCLSAGNADKSCYTLVLEWLNTEIQDEEF